MGKNRHNKREYLDTFPLTRKIRLKVK